jgi:hypothetical protein
MQKHHIKLAPLIKEIEVVRPFSGRITNVDELGKYLDFLEVTGTEFYEDYSKTELLKEYELYEHVTLPPSVKSLYNLRYVKGDITISWNRHMTKLPNNLTIDGSLSITYSTIEEIPNKLNITGTFYINFTPLEEKYSLEEIMKMIVNNGGKVEELNSKIGRISW